MAGYSHTTIVGHVGREPEMRYTQAGKAVTSFSVAVSRKYKGEESTTWFNVTCWDKLAEIANDYVKTGKKVLIAGRIELDEYTRKDGTGGASLKLTAQELQLLDSKGDQQDGQQNADPMGPAPEAPATAENLPF